MFFLIIFIFLNYRHGKCIFLFNCSINRICALINVMIFNPLIFIRGNISSFLIQEHLVDLQSRNSFHHPVELYQEESEHLLDWLDHPCNSVGDNDEGQLDNGKRSSYESTPQKIAENVVHVNYAASFMIYLTENGELYGTGANQNGLMGLKNPYGKEWIYYDDIVATSPVCLITDVKYARASHSGIIALKNDGSVWWWGEIRTTSAKNPDNTIGCSYSEPTKMLDDAIYVTCWPFCMAAIKADGTLWTWGNNTFGSCGYDSKNQDFIELYPDSYRYG